MFDYHDRICKVHLPGNFCNEKREREREELFCYWKQKLSSLPQNLLDREMEKTRAINSNSPSLASAKEGWSEAGQATAAAAVYIKELQ